MSHWKSDGMRTWVLSAAVTGLLIPSMAAFGQSKGFFPVPRTSPRRSVPAQPTQAPLLLAVPSEAEASPIIPTAGEKSEVQKQLEALYQQDGREMPEIPLQPMTPLSSQPQQPQTAQPQQTSPAVTATAAPPAPLPGMTNPKPVRPAQGYTQYQPRTQATPYTLQPANQPNAQPQMNTGANATSQVPPHYLPQYQSQAGSRQNPIAGFFRRISGTNKPLSTQPPTPPDAMHLVPGTAPYAVSSNGTPAAAPAAAKGTTSAMPLVQSDQSGSTPMLSSTPTSPLIKPNTTNLQTTSGTNAASAEATPPPLISLPVLSAEALPLKTVSDGSLPPLMTEAQPNQLMAKTESAGRPTGEISIDFPNPFTELTETDADRKVRNSPSTNGNALDTSEMGDPSRKPETSAEPDTTAKTDDNPFDVPAKDFSEPVINDTKAPAKWTTKSPLIDSSLPPASAIMPNIGAPHPDVARLAPELPPEAEKASDPVGREHPLSDEAAPKQGSKRPTPQVDDIVVQPPVQSSTPAPADTTPDPSVEKMRRIRERFGMKGLKGFCPVTLHDERELVDARPDFHFTYRSQKFHFASEEARDKFHADPGKYAPAAYGADVVALSRDKDVVEGTLDFAAWFKGRLYLFGSQANYDTFIASPSKFATLVEGE